MTVIVLDCCEHPRPGVAPAATTLAQRKITQVVPGVLRATTAT